jgi:hypothetical protein
MEWRDSFRGRTNFRSVQVDVARNPTKSGGKVAYGHRRLANTHFNSLIQ